MQQQLPTSAHSFLKTSAKRLTYAQRAQLCSNPVAKRLFALMESKKTNLVASLDVTRKHELLELADAVGPYVCMIKTHIDIVSDFDWSLITQLQQLAAKHDFVLFEDRKFADIGNTVQLQYAKGIYRIAEWADVINAHSVPGPGIIEGLRSVGLHREKALILLPQMSSAGTLATGDYTATTLKMAQKYQDFVIGFIAREKLINDPTFIHFTPGVKLQQGSDALGQQYLTPVKVISDGSDCIIVGRGLYESSDPVVAAQEYCAAGWDAYQDDINEKY